MAAAPVSSSFSAQFHLILFKFTSFHFILCHFISFYVILFHVTSFYFALSHFIPRSSRPLVFPRQAVPSPREGRPPPAPPPPCLASSSQQRPAPSPAARHAPLVPSPFLICIPPGAPIGAGRLINMQGAGQSASAGAGPPRAVAKLRLLNCYHSRQPIAARAAICQHSLPQPEEKGGEGRGSAASPAFPLVRRRGQVPPPAGSGRGDWRRGLPVGRVSK